MRPPNLNEDTLKLLYETGVENLPEYERWLDCPEDEIRDRFVVIGEEVVGEEVTRGFGGCWPTIDDALESYDWNAGAPVFLIDIFEWPSSALRDIRLIPRADVFSRNLANEHGDPVIP